MNHIRTLIAACFLALSFFGGASEARAEDPAGHRFCDRGIVDKEDFARRIENAANENSRLEGCRVTPRQVLEAFQHHLRTQNIDASVNSVAELPAFVRSLEETTASQDIWFNTDCLWEVNGRDRVKVDCHQRYLEQGERIFGLPDREGNFVVLLYSGCANTGSGEVKIVVVADCIRVIFPTTFVGQPVRGAYIGPRALPGRCHSLTASGMDEPFPSWPEECPDTYREVRGGRTVTIVCDWSGAEDNSTRIMGKPMQVQNVSYSFKARAAGTDNMWVLPVEALEGLPTLCWEMPDGTFIALSVSREHFVNGVATVTVADIEASRWQQ